MLLRDPGDQLRAREKKVLSVSQQKSADDRKKQRVKSREREKRMRWFRREWTRAETALRVALAIVPLLAVGGLLAYASTLPADWQVQRSATLPASPKAVFSVLQDVSTWPSWAKVAPFEGATLAYPVGKTGRHAAIEVHAEGLASHRLLIAEYKEPEQLGYFLWQGTTTIPRHGVLDLQQDGANTTVTWTETGAYTDDPLGMLGRLGTERRIVEITAMMQASLAALPAAVDRMSKARGKTQRAAGKPTAQ